MDSSKDQIKQPYATPTFSRYGDVRDLTRTVSPTTGHYDGTVGKGNPRTH